MSIKTRLKKLEQTLPIESEHDKNVFSYYLARDRENILKCSRAKREFIYNMAKGLNAKELTKEEMPELFLCIEHYNFKTLSNKQELEFLGLQDK